MPFRFAPNSVRRRAQCKYQRNPANIRLQVEQLEDRTLLSHDPGFAFSIGGAGFDYISDVVADAVGNLYVTGSFKGSVDFDPGAGTHFLDAAAGGIDAFVAKYSATGILEWAYNVGGSAFGYHGPDHGDLGVDIALDSNNNVYVAGRFMGMADFGGGPANVLTSRGLDDVFVWKLNTNGVTAWARRMGGNSGDEGYGLAVDTNGSAYVTGPFYSTNADFGPFTLSSIRDADVFMAKLDSDGNFVWAKQIEGTSGESSRAVAVDAGGNSYFLGIIFDPTDLNPGPDTFTRTPSNGDIFVLKLDSIGNFVWARQLGGSGTDEGYGMVMDSTENLYVSGLFYGTLNFGPGPSIENPVSAGGQDAFVAKLDRDGNYLWARGMGGVEDDAATRPTLDASGNVYAAGSFSGTADFDPGASLFQLTSRGDSDVFVASLGADGTFRDAWSMGGATTDHGISLAVDQSGHIVAVGRFTGTANMLPSGAGQPLNSQGSFDGFVSKFAPADCVDPPAGLISWWPGEGNADDIVGGNDGILKNGARADAVGKVGQAFSLDGVDDLVEIPDAPNLTPPSAITLEAWVNPDTVAPPGTASRAIISKYDSPAGQVSWWLGYFDGGRIRFVVQADGGAHRTINTNSPVLTPGTWTHVAAAFDVATQQLKIYVNGVIVPQTLEDNQFVGAMMDSSTPVRIGGWRFGDGTLGFWHGLIDEPSIYSRALDADEIRGIYEAGAAGKCKDAAPLPTVSISGPTAPVVEGDNGSTNAEFTVTLSAPSATDVVVAYQVIPGTATVGVDYLLPAELTVTIPHDQTTAKIFIPIVGDRQLEPDETFTVQLTAITSDNAAIDSDPTKSATEATILADDFGIDRWWATANLDNAIPVSWAVNVPEGGVYHLRIANASSWTLDTDTATVLIDGQPSETSFTRPDGLGTYVSGGFALSSGVHVVTVDSFDVPDLVGVDDIQFGLYSGPYNVFSAATDNLHALFIADHSEEQSGLTLAEKNAMIRQYAPILHFAAEDGSKERYQVPFDVDWELQQLEAGAFGAPADRLAEEGLGNSEDWLDLSSLQAGFYSDQPGEFFVLTKSAIYASILKNADLNELAINYYFHYPRSNWAEHGGFNTHEGDWEGSTVFLSLVDGSWMPDRLALAQHIRINIPGVNEPARLDGGDLVENWSDLYLTGDRPNLYVGLGGHATYAGPGVTTWPVLDLGELFFNDEVHNGAGASFVPREDGANVRYLPRVAAANAQDWLRYPGHWGNPDLFGLFTLGDTGPRGPVFEDNGFDPGTRWLDPWNWAEGFNRIHAPVAIADGYRALPGKELNISAAFGVVAYDRDDDLGDENKLKARISTYPGHGSLILNDDGSFRYTPGTTFSGLDSFTYVANDNSLDSKPATVTIFVSNLLTIITHGLQEGLTLNGGSFPTWVYDMATAISIRRPPAVEMSIDRNNNRVPDLVENARINYNDALQIPADSFPDLLLFDWAEKSGLRNPGIADDDEIAGRLRDLVRQRLGPELKLNIHFIGHSRGAFVVRSAISELSPADNDKIDDLQMTTLDPQAYLPFTEGATVVPSNVDFADNYYQQTDGFFEPAGESILNAVNVDLTSVLAAWSGRPDSYFDLNIQDHTEVHDWYHWTIDLTDGDGPSLIDPDLPALTPQERLDLYCGDNSARVGFAWSVIGGSVDQRPSPGLYSAPPTIDAIQIADGPQRSMINSIVVTFAEPMVVQPGAFDLRSVTGASVSLMVTAEAGNTSFTITFTGQEIIGGSLADGNYVFRVLGEKVRSAATGFGLDGDNDGRFGGDAVTEFFRLFGDSDGNGIVDNVDFDLFRTSLGKRRGDPGFLWYFDYDGNGIIDQMTDLREFNLRRRRR